MIEIEELDLTVQQLLTTEQAWHYRIIPKDLRENEIHFFVSEKSRDNEFLSEELEIMLGKRVVLDFISEEVIQRNLTRYYRKTQAGANAERIINVRQDENFLANLILESKQLGSSDIHIESYEEKCRVRIRIDGMLIERFQVDKSEYPSLINKIKILANLDISEKRLPQDGRINFRQDETNFDIRVSVLPTFHGEKIVLRILGKDAEKIDIQSLGFRKNDLDRYLSGIKKPHGIVLISGPTGSGKTTTLYSTLKILNQVRTNILTIEDPVEYTLTGINQVQLKENIGLTFAQAIRTFMRQDPDVIMLGEIRDPETAQMAIRAALTGHLVLSTIHTNSAWGTIFRLCDMGIQPFLIAGTLNTTVAQRLVKLLCKECKEEIDFNPEEVPGNLSKGLNVKRQSVPRGCEVCFHTGYKGRKAIYEVIPIDNILTECIRKEQQDINEILTQKEISTLKDNALQLFIDGETSFEEIYPILVSN